MDLPFSILQEMLSADFVDLGCGYYNLLSVGDRPFRLLLPEPLVSNASRRLKSSLALEDYDPSA